MFNKKEYNQNLIKIAKKLRAEMTKQERHLWYDFLRYYPVKFYKQKVIGNYIVDFYSPAAKLAIEIDGNQHKIDEIYERDLLRTQVINKHGIKVIRFSNADIDHEFETVCELIKREINNK